MPSDEAVVLEVLERANLLGAVVTHRGSALYLCRNGKEVALCNGETNREVWLIALDSLRDQATVRSLSEDLG